MSQQLSIAALAQRIAREFTAVRAEMFNGSKPPNATQKFAKVTMSQYKALAVKDPYTVYLLVEE